MKTVPPLLLSLLSGILLFASWPVSPLTFLIFAGFIPLLWLEEQTSSVGRFFGWTYLTLLFWNIGSTWWVCEASVSGGLLAILLNPLLMTVPWIGFYQVKKKLGRLVGYSSLIVFWLTFEYIHLNWQLSWPWLTLGNVFATHPGWVQWYQFTGVGGGSLWILLANLGLFHLLKKRIHYTILVALILLLPLVLSYLLLRMPHSTESVGNRTEASNVVIVQPNIDPYNKFDSGKEKPQLQELIQLSRSQIDSQTALVVWPETAIPVALNEDSMKTNHFMASVWEFLKKYPHLSLLTGVEGFRFYTAQNKTASSERIPGSDTFTDAYNSAALMDSNSIRIYHKSKLVPGVETIPSYFHFLEPIFEKFGGATGSYATQEERTVLGESNGIYNIAPSICYESIYGEFMSKYVKKGADLIVIITNDGWWGNTPGYKQHENYARLRAIETRRWVVRSANTGISCFIDPYGHVLKPQAWDQAVAIKMNIPASRALSFYVRNGDFIFKAAGLASIGILLWSLVIIIKRKRSIA